MQFADMQAAHYSDSEHKRTHRERGREEMGRRDREKEQLNRALTQHFNTIHETLQVLNKTAASSLEKVSWNEVIQMGEQVSKQATIVGMLWTGEIPEAKSIEENMATYFNTLQGFVLLSHGSTVGAGPTLASNIHTSVKQVVDSSFKLMMGTVNLFGSSHKDRERSVPQFVGEVWEACSSLKKTPATNITAIGRAMTQVAVSVKDVLREMKEIKPPSSNSTGEIPDNDSTNSNSRSHDDDASSLGDLGDDLSPEEYKVTESTTGVVSETLVFIKELIRAITGLLKAEKPDDSGDFINSLENLLKLCQGIGVQIDELGACVYPPQEVSAMRAALEKISNIIDDVQKEVENFTTSSEGFAQACSGLRSSLKDMNSELDCSNTNDLETKLQNVAVSD